MLGYRENPSLREIQTRTVVRVGGSVKYYFPICNADLSK
jgi:hypothetical protein